MAYPALTVTIDGKEHTVTAAQGDYVRLEQHTRTSVRRLDWSVEHIVTLAYFAARRTGLVPADTTLDWWLDHTESHLVPDEEEGEGKASGQDQPTG